MQLEKYLGTAITLITLGGSGLMGYTQLKAKVSEHESRITRAETQGATFTREQIVALNTKTETLEKRVDTVEKEMNGIETKLNDIYTSVKVIESSMKQLNRGITNAH